MFIMISYLPALDFCPTLSSGMSFTIRICASWHCRSAQVKAMLQPVVVFEAYLSGAHRLPVGGNW